MDGFKPGLVGGLLHFAGKAVLGLERPAYRVAGTQIAAVGSSMTTNAGAGRGLVERLSFPVGPLDVVVSSSSTSGRAIDLHLSAYDLMVIGEQLLVADRRLWWQESLRSGTLVFLTRGNEVLATGRNGFANGSVIVIDDGVPPHERDALVTHELVHVAQTAFVNQVIGNPLERYLWSRIFNGANLTHRVELDLLYPGTRSFLSFLGIGNGGIPFLEYEAEMIEAWATSRNEP